MKAQIKSPQLLRAAFDRERFLITDKHTDILEYIPCVVRQRLQKSERKQTHKQTTDGWTDAAKRIISLASRSIISECILYWTTAADLSMGACRLFLANCSILT